MQPSANGAIAKKPIVTRGKITIQVMTARACIEGDTSTFVQSLFLCIDCTKSNDGGQHDGRVA
jgi:hypothetical protein